MTSTRSTVRDPGPRTRTGSTHCSLGPKDSLRVRGTGRSVGETAPPQPALTDTRVAHEGRAMVDEEARRIHSEAHRRGNRFGTGDDRLQRDAGWRRLECLPCAGGHPWFVQLLDHHDDDTTGDHHHDGSTSDHHHDHGAPDDDHDGAPDDDDPAGATADLGDRYPAPAGGDRADRAGHHLGGGTADPAAVHRPEPQAVPVRRSSPGRSGARPAGSLRVLAPRDPSAFGAPPLWVPRGAPGPPATRRPSVVGCSFLGL